MPRLFVALPVPHEVRASLAGLREELGGARWTPPEQYHLTLRFLGDTPDERIPELQRALAAVTCPPLALRADRLTTFPNRRQPRVLVVRLVATSAASALQREVEAIARAHGSAAADRPFRPHLTLARLRDADPEAVWRFTQEHRVDLAFSVDHFALYASTLTPDGAVHERLATYPLTG
jgi:RNA 2',3'-cyclic 3'-phosphodiesterase